MLALSVSQPWASLLAWGLKDVENRAYPPPDAAIGQPLLIHAPLQPDPTIWREDGILPLWQRDGAVLIPDLPAQSAYPFGGILGYATLVGVVRRSASPWFVGPYGWQLRNARPLPFLRRPGRPKYFDLRYPRLERLVQARLEQAPAHNARVIYTLGYRSPGAMPLLEHLVAERCPILDCRLWPWSNVDYFQQFDQECLLQRFNLLYLPMRTLGNINFKRSDLPHQLANPDIGLALALSWLESMGKICLLCGCPDYHSCHRNLIATLLQQRSQQEARTVPCHIAHLLVRSPRSVAFSVRTEARTPRNTQRAPAQQPAEPPVPQAIQLNLFEER